MQRRCVSGFPAARLAFSPHIWREMRMPNGRLCAHVALVALLWTASAADLRAHDETKYPDWKGQWVRIGPGFYDPANRPGLGQQAPLTEEYQKILEASLADQAAGGQGNDPTIICIPGGMPRAMIVTQPMEVVITPETTYVMLELHMMLRRIFTDGRPWPEEIAPSYMGYSIGEWKDTDGDGRYDTLLVETRGLKLPRSYDNSGMPFHKDGKTVIKERIFLDQANPDTLRNEITVIDSALTRPWTVTRIARRETKADIRWFEYACAADNQHVIVGKESYLVSGDGHLMPVRKNQPPPDLRHFSTAPK
jgi:hypothetical protein